MKPSEAYRGTHTREPRKAREGYKESYETQYTREHTRESKTSVQRKPSDTQRRAHQGIQKTGTKGGKRIIQENRTKEAKRRRQRKPTRAKRNIQGKPQDGYNGSKEGHIREAYKGSQETDTRELVVVGIYDASVARPLVDVLQPGRRLTKAPS
jgi:hypothetical protein